MRTSQKSTIPQFIICLAFIASVAGFLALLPPVPQPKSTGVEPSKSEAYQAKVIRVSDGDTIVVRTHDSTVKIRLAQIDAPELSQPWGEKSRQALKTLLSGKTIIVLSQGYDRYGRTIAELNVGDRNINQDMVARGAAWAYRDYLHDAKILALEADARGRGDGLWALPIGQRIAPWDYRAQRRETPKVMVGR
jgi:micrococcal nuclease